MTHHNCPQCGAANAPAIAVASELAGALELCLEQLGQFTGWGKSSDEDADAAMDDAREALANAGVPAYVELRNERQKKRDETDELANFVDDLMKK